MKTEILSYFFFGFLPLLFLMAASRVSGHNRERAPREGATLPASSQRVGSPGRATGSCSAGFSVTNSVQYIMKAMTSLPGTSACHIHPEFYKQLLRICLASVAATYRC